MRNLDIAYAASCILRVGAVGAVAVTLASAPVQAQTFDPLADSDTTQDEVYWEMAERVVELSGRSVMNLYSEVRSMEGTAQGCSWIDFHRNHDFGENIADNWRRFGDAILRAGDLDTEQRNQLYVSTRGLVEESIDVIENGPERFANVFCPNTMTWEGY